MAKKILFLLIVAIFLPMKNVAADALQNSLDQVKKQVESISSQMFEMNAVRITDSGAENFLEDMLNSAYGAPVEFTDLEYFPEFDINGGFLTIWISAFDRENPDDDSEYMNNPDGAVAFLINGEGYISLISVTKLSSSRDPKIYYETINVVLNAIGLDELEKIELLSSAGSMKNAYCRKAGRRIYMIYGGDSVAIFATEY